LFKERRKSVVKCPVCQRENPENTPFCNECGTYLLGGSGRETELRSVGGVTRMNGEETTESPSEPSWSGVTDNIFGRMSTRMNREKNDRDS
jgi:hypothetical protein